MCNLRGQGNYMDFYVDGKYSAFEELMYYYHWDFYVYYILVIILLVNCVKAIVNFIAIRKCKASDITLSFTDLIISSLAGMGLMCGVFFQGILSDISSKYSKIWWNEMFVLCIAAFVLFIVQVNLTSKIESIKNKKNEL